LGYLPKTINHDVTISITGTGTQASATVAGFGGAGSLTITGALIAADTDGEQSGTCSAATTTTCTPTAPGWAASGLLGYLVEFTDVGPGTLTYRVPTINTTGVMTVLAVSTLNNNDTYRMVMPGTVFTSLTVKQTSLPVTFNYIEASDLALNDNRNLTFNASRMVGISGTSANNMLETYTNSSFVSSSTMAWTNATTLTLTNVVLYASNVTATGVRRITGDVVALSTTTSSALTLSQVDRAALGFDAKNCTFTPLTLTDVTRYQVSGIGLTGTSNTGGFGFIASGTTDIYYTATPTLVGTSNAQVNGTTVIYTSQVGVRQFWGGSSITSAATDLILVAATVAGNTVGSTGTSSGYLYNQGAVREAFASVAGAGTTISDATAASARSYVFITSGAASSGFKLQTPTVTPGVTQEIINQTANNILIYPSAVGVQIDALGAGNPYTLGPGKAIKTYSASATQYYTVALN
jgi:hypothetical protein